MPAKKKAKTTAQPTYDIKGGVHANEFVGGDKTVYNAGRDIIQRDQINVTTITQPPQSMDELKTFLATVQAQLAALQQTALTAPQQQMVESAGSKVAEAVEEAARPAPVGERIKATLTEAKEYMDAIGGSLASAAALGTTLGTILLGVVKLFGL